MAATSAEDWADGRRVLRTEVLSPTFVPDLHDARYRLMMRREIGVVLPSWPAIVLVLLWGVAVFAVSAFDLPRAIGAAAALLVLASHAVRLWSSVTKRRVVALWLTTPDDGPPDLVFPVAADALAGDEPSSGTAQAFGDLVPNGVLAVIVDDTVVWPIYPPRAGTTGDARRARRSRERRARTR